MTEFEKMRNGEFYDFTNEEGLGENVFINYNGTMLDGVGSPSERTAGWEAA